MTYTLQQVARALREARKSQGLSQRALSAKAGIPQSHISKIENGAVDLRISSLIELARILDLELELVPRNAVAGVRALARRSRKSALDVREANRRTIEELAQLESAVARSTLAHPTSEELVQTIQHQVRELRYLPVPDDLVREIRIARKAIQSWLENGDGADAVLDALSNLQSQHRKALAQLQASVHEAAAVKPAYTLDSDEDD